MKNCSDNNKIIEVNNVGLHRVNLLKNQIELKLNFLNSYKNSVEEKTQDAIIHLTTPYEGRGNIEIAIVKGIPEFCTS